MKSSPALSSSRLCALRHVFAILLLPAAISCAREAPQTQRPEAARRVPPPSPAPGTPQAPATPAATPAASDSITQKDLRALLEQGRELYWGITSLRIEERSSIAGFPVARINPAQAPTMEALRGRYRGVFTERAIDTVLADFGVIFHEGKLWMADADGCDISEYDKVEIISMQWKEDRLLVRMSVPLGEEGGKEERIVRLVRSGNRWLLDSNAYGGEMIE